MHEENLDSTTEELAPDVQALVNQVDVDLANAGINVDVNPDEDASINDPAPFTSRKAARDFVAQNGGVVVDNGPDAEHRWTVTFGEVPTEETPAPKTTKGKTKSKSKTKTKRKAKAAPKKERTPKTDTTKAKAIALYHELEKAGTLKRKTFIDLMLERHGFSEKGSSSYFYRIKKGEWS